MRHRPRLDSTQRAIVDELRKVGVSVYSAAPLGGGFPDLIAGHAGVNYLLEVKSARAIRKRTGTVNPHRDPAGEKQESFRRRWRGAPVVVVTTPAEAFRALGLTLGGPVDLEAPLLEP